MGFEVDPRCPCAAVEGGDDVGLGLEHQGEQVAGKVDPAALVRDSSQTTESASIPGRISRPPGSALNAQTGLAPQRDTGD